MRDMAYSRRSRAPLINLRLVKESTHCPGQLPRFARPLGLDFIITDRERIYLVELQHGFGRRGLLELFPAVNRNYRQTYWQLRREYGRSTPLIRSLQRICGNKINTYRLFAREQPASFVYRGWSTDLAAWLHSVPSEIVLAKPPRGSCGKGIVVLKRQELLQDTSGLQRDLPLDHPMLLQEYVSSRPQLDDQQRPHLGCIRHIALLVSDGVTLRTIHLPSYWRVSPVPYTDPPDKAALTANISRGAIARPITEQEARLVQPLAERICCELIGHIFQLPSPPSSSSEVLPGA